MGSASEGRFLLPVAGGSPSAEAESEKEEANGERPVSFPERASAVHLALPPQSGGCRHFWDIFGGAPMNDKCE